MRRVLITGGAGFIGTSLVRHLYAAGQYDITVLDNETSGDARRLQEFETIKFINGDILDDDQVAAALAGIDTVIHLAADTRVVDSIKSPERNFRINALGTFRLLERARLSGARRFVNASTGGAILGEARPPIDETMPANPASPYGASKLAGEGYCSAFRESYGLSTVSLRFSNVYGPGSWHKGSVIATFFRNILAGDELTVFGDGTQVRDYLFINDLVAGIELAMNADAHGAIQLASGLPTSLNDLISEISRLVGPGYLLQVRREPPRRGEIHTTWCQIDRARKILGFAPKTSLRDGLQQTWDWFRSNYGQGDRPAIAGAFDRD